MGCFSILFSVFIFLFGQSGDAEAFGDHCIIGAVGVDVEGRKHLLGIQERATENAAAVKDLLERLVAPGVDPNRKRLFVIDGSKALRTAINAVFGAQNHIQRCRQNKLRNVVDRVAEDQKEQVKALMKAAWKLGPKEGMAKMRKLSEWLSRGICCKPPRPTPPARSPLPSAFTKRYQRSCG